MGAFWAMAWNGYREARRNRVTVVVGIFAAVVLLCTSLVTEVTINTFARVMTDFGLGMMSLILVFLAIFLSSGLLAKEIERRTIFLIVSKPVSRAKFILARLTGNMLTLGLLLLAMLAVFGVQLAFYLQPLNEPQLAAVAGLWFELWVLSSMGFLFSSFSGPVVSALASVGIYFSGHLSADIYNLSAKSKGAILPWLGKAIYYLLPNLERVNFREQAGHGAHVPLPQFASGCAYALAYSAVATCAAILIFNRRDFR